MVTHQEGKKKLRSVKCRIQVQRRLLLERLSERRVLAAITGTVFEDADHSFRQEAGETSLGGRIVYLDANDNALLDRGEAFRLTDGNGGFRFDDLVDSDYILRLFNGTGSQRQTIPVEAALDGAAIPVANGRGLTLTDSSAVALTTNAVVLGDFKTGANLTIPVAENLTKMQALPDGTLLVIGGDGTGETAWVVDLIGGAAVPIDLSGGGQLIVWDEVAIDGNGQGVLLESSPDASAVNVWAIDASNPAGPIKVTDTEILVPSDTQVLTSDSGVRSVFGWIEDDKLQLSLWSNVEEGFITEGIPGESEWDPVEVPGATDLLAYDDDSGWLLLRNDDGGVGVYDANLNFAQLHTFTDMTGPVTLDGPRDLLISVSPVDSMLRLVDLRDGSKIAELAVDLSTVGAVSHMAVREKPDSVVVLGAAGMTEIALRKPAAYEITITDGLNADPVMYGISIDGDNSPPAYDAFPDLTTPEDSKLAALAPAALSGATDPDGDLFVVLSRGEPSFGRGSVYPDGAIDYTPNRDFNGTDTISVVLHDGRSESDEFNLPIIVTPLPDPPTDVVIHIDPVPENIGIGAPIGDIEVVDADGGNDHVIQISDSRFRGQAGQIIFVGGDINFEYEPRIPLVISVSDMETSTTLIREVTVSVTNANDPITAITLSTSNPTVVENVAGHVFGELLVHDEDFEQFHLLSVNDDRFVIDERDLRLADDESLDYESEQQVTVLVTATEFDTGNTFTQPFTINVIDVPEQPQNIELTDHAVLELEPGDEVGSVRVDGSSSGYLLSVDDPRFEIVNSTLKLVDNVFVERATQTEIQLTISAQDTGGQFEPISKTFVIEVIENPTPYHNDDDPYDVDGNGRVSANDALAIIDYLNTYGPGPVGQGDPGYGFDVNSDGFVTALDALLILNELNRQQNGGGTVGGEHEDVDGEGEQITPTPANLIAGPEHDAPPPIDQLREFVFGLIEQEAADGYADFDDAQTLQDHHATIHARDADASREFTENVDETLRLLSDRVN